MSVVAPERTLRTPHVPLCGDGITVSDYDGRDAHFTCKRMQGHPGDHLYATQAWTGEQVSVLWKRL